MQRIAENWRDFLIWIVLIALFNVVINQVGDVNVWALILLNFTLLDIFAIWFLSEFWVA
jgi:hypothetical protein